ncbi:MAG: hypothetical protein HYY06_07430 [Deltaproteobacteria bacterium]|nr:hypothetical protein [Deltaproteobacteria bacterium]
MRVFVLLFLLSSSEGAALALPRFAARNAGECIQCHVNPTGGGMRNEYGRNVFEQAILPWSTSADPGSWMAPRSLSGDPAADDGVRAPFGGEVTDWLAVGGDLRAAYIYIRPDRGLEPGADPEVTSSFFLMQADLYHAATLNPWVSLVLDVGIYSGFEAWGLLRFFREPGDLDLMLKVGHFMPAFGIREVEHQLFTREGIGLGAQDRDTGLELTTFAGPVTLNLSVLNGTLGDTAFDVNGSERRTFEKAVAARLAARAQIGWLRGQLGLSLYWNDGYSQPNPLFGGRLPAASVGEASRGVTEVRKGAFLTLNLGRLTYLGDLALVDDDFASDQLDDIGGYASYQELSFVLRQGLELVGTFEFMEPDLEILDDSSTRAAVVVEFFPWPLTELRAMVRRRWNDDSPTGGTTDLVLFLHLFM